MKRGIFLPTAAFGLLAMFLFTGCFGVDGNFVHVRNDLLSAPGTNFHRDVEFSLGSAGMAIARMAVKYDDKDDNAKEILNNVSRVQIGVYKNHNRFIPEERFAFFDKADSKMRSQGWQAIVKNYDKNEMNIIYVIKNDDDKPDKIFVVSLNRKELVMVEVSGNLEKILVAVIKDKGMNFQFADSN